MTCGLKQSQYSSRLPFCGLAQSRFSGLLLDWWLETQPCQDPSKMHMANIEALKLSKVVERNNKRKLPLPKTAPLVGAGQVFCHCNARDCTRSSE